MSESRRWFDAPLARAGTIATGEGMLAAEAPEADVAHVGSPFIATPEAQVAPGYRRMVVAGDASSLVKTDHFSGSPATYPRASVHGPGLDRDALPASRATLALAAAGEGPEARRDVRSAGQGIGAVEAGVPARERIAAMAEAYVRRRGELWPRRTLSARLNVAPHLRHRRNRRSDLRSGST